MAPPQPLPMPTPMPTSVSGTACVNGHPMGPGDEICMTCGADRQGEMAHPPGTAKPVKPVESDQPIVSLEIASLSEVRRLNAHETFETFTARHSSGRDVLLTLYQLDAEPDPAVQNVLRHMPLDHIPEFIETGRFEGRSYEISELIAGGTLRQAGYLGTDPVSLNNIVNELWKALASFEELGLRHRDLSPDTVALRTRDPLDLVVTGFGSARLSDFDLDAVAPLELTRYSAPEAIVGAVSGASDWWSLGMIVLEQITAGLCFEGADDLAFRLHVVTRGVDLPANLDRRLRSLLRGLLTRDAHHRWSTGEVRAWLDGLETEDEPDVEVPQSADGPSISLAGRPFTQPDLLALECAQEVNWNDALALLGRGEIATWCGAQKNTKLLSEIRRIGGVEGLSDDYRLALTLMAMNPALPLVVRGEIVTPAWLLANADSGYELITGEVVRQLRRMDREPWLVGLGVRAEVVRDRARLLEIELDETRVRPALLSTSRANLEAERDTIRLVYPDSDHNGLASIIERPRINDEDLIILVGAAQSQFTPIATLLAATRDLAGKIGVAYDETTMSVLLVKPRRTIFEQIDERTANFARSGNARIDEWVDAFRVERRISLPRAATVMAMPAASWQQPPKQQYVATLLGHFEKRVTGTVSRGPLARFVIGKTTPRVDLRELDGPLRSAEQLLNHVLARTDGPMTIDPIAYTADENRGSRLRRLINHAATFRRDSGLDGRTLGFPFLVSRDSKTATGDAHPRVAPILLWPVALDMSAATGVTLSFDREREEVRLNPALEAIVPPGQIDKWKDAVDDTLRRTSLKYTDVIDIFAGLAPPTSQTLERVLSKDAKVATGTFELHSSAALFNAEFTGQSVAEDLRQMIRMPPGGTSLEAALRISAEPAKEIPEPDGHDRHLVVDSDPSQNLALGRSRNAPGLLVEGPPGTGKSQTIVNVVADAIGRGETVLIVCQKQAALQVVRKRLDAEGLGDRLVLVSDTNRDREPIVKAIREQRDNLRATSPDDLAKLRRQRDGILGRLGQLESEIDAIHFSLYRSDPETGLSYRNVIAALIQLEAQGPSIAVPELRPLLGSISTSQLAAMEETVGPLSSMWLQADYEQSPLGDLKPFPVDTTTTERVRSALFEVVEADRERQQAIAGTTASPEITDAEEARNWIARIGQKLQQLPENRDDYVRAWIAHFRSDSRAAPMGPNFIAKLETIQRSIEAVPGDWGDPTIFGSILELTDERLAVRLEDARRFITRASIFGKLRPSYWSRRRRVRRYARKLSIRGDRASITKLGNALELEIRLREFRIEINALIEQLGLPPIGVKDLKATGAHVSAILTVLKEVQDLSVVLLASPWSGPAMTAAAGNLRADLAQLCDRMLGALRRHASRVASRAALQSAAVWMTDDWVAASQNAIESSRTADLVAPAILQALPSLSAYQRFRARAASLPQDTLRVFAILRAHQQELSPIPSAEVDSLLRRTLQREALLHRKAAFESLAPELFVDPAERERKVSSLAQLSTALLDLNRQLLRSNIDVSSLGAQTAWEDLTRLRGPRSRRLREVLDQGADIGLMKMRPVWLMNPDVASRILPLKAGLFDLAIFDEASQMPVEFAVPTLFRAKRVLIAGDEKQMPPTSFFASRIDDDEDPYSVDTESMEGATEAEQTALEETWNRREVKDCPDLLQLARGVVPTSTLQIHYRSKYRELIEYSNAAFYRGALSVPVQHPEAEVQKARPIEVVVVNGVYESQINKQEAGQVVEILARLWSRPSPPSVGVVSFNRKQADVVEEAIQARAAADAAFDLAYRRELGRTHEGEDMGFFVKNVENVQGDERDVIIFSTTFGRDRNGAFRRNFGVLGQSGGERRLNVAVTRAREKVILVTSIPVADVSDWLTAGRSPDKPRDFLQAYLDYARRVSAGDLDAVDVARKRLGGAKGTGPANDGADDDGFVDAVGRFIAGEGFDPVRPPQRDAFVLDFAVVDPGTGRYGIGIECDSPRHALLKRARDREVWRPRVLRGQVPFVHRVSSQNWYQNPDEEKAKLRAALRASLGRREVA